MGFFAFLLILVLLAIGFLYFRIKISRIREERDLINLYITKFRAFSQTYLEEFDDELFSWLSYRALKIQSLTGAPHIIKKLGSDGQDDFTRKRESLINTLEQMAQRVVPPEKVSSVSSFLMFYLGGLEEYINDTEKQQWHPLILFRGGVEFVLLLFVTAFKWTSDGNVEELRDQILESPRFKSWAAILTVVAFVCPVLILAFGWSTLSGFIGQIVQWLIDFFWLIVDTIQGLIEDR